MIRDHGGPAFLERGEGGIPVLFLHGIGGGAEAWEPQLAHFAARRRALAWWMPGYGPSPALPETGFAALAANVETLLDRAGAERVHLVGHSIGGMIAQIFAATRGSRLASLTLSATSAAFGSPDGGFQRRFLESRLGPLDRGLNLADIAATIVAELVGEAPDPRGVRLAAESMARVPVASYRGALQAIVTFDARPLLPAITAPTLLIAGSRDTNAPAAMMERMARRIAGARFVACEGAGHLANLERPDSFNQAVEAFIGEVEAKSEAHQAAEAPVAEVKAKAGS